MEKIRVGGISPSPFPFLRDQKYATEAHTTGSVQSMEIYSDLPEIGASLYTSDIRRKR